MIKKNFFLPYTYDNVSVEDNDLETSYEPQIISLLRLPSFPKEGVKYREVKTIEDFWDVR